MAVHSIQEEACSKAPSQEVRRNLATLQEALDPQREVRNQEGQDRNMGADNIPPPLVEEERVTLAGVQEPWSQDPVLHRSGGANPGLRSLQLRWMRNSRRLH